VSLLSFKESALITACFYLPLLLMNLKLFFFIDSFDNLIIHFFVVLIVRSIDIAFVQIVRCQFYTFINILRRINFISLYAMPDFDTL
jgi:hypothetical protein